jgi:hypothetical protein
MTAPLPPGPPPRPGERADVGDLARFEERIDVRSPAEFAEDRIPGAIGLPGITCVLRYEAVGLLALFRGSL